MTADMASTMVRIGFFRTTPVDPERLEDLAEICLASLTQKARFVAFGPVVSVNFERNVIEVEFTACTKQGTDEEIRAVVERVELVVRSALAEAEYETSAERVFVSA